MKLNLPSKSKKLISLSLLGLVTRGVKAGENFKKCLTNNDANGGRMYDSLIEYNYS